MTRLLALFALLLGLAGALPWLVPLAKQSVRLIAARDDPARLADLGLAGLTTDEIDRRMAEALAADDAALAASYLELADARRLPVSKARRAEVTAANAGTAQALRTARDFGIGFLSGQPEDLAGLAGAALSDLMVWGDIRDAGREGLHLARGEEVDELILGLSAVGLAVTASTYATGGTSLPVRAGVSLVKAAKQTGRLSAALGRTLTRAARESLDFDAVRRLAKAPAALDGAALRSVVRTDAVKPLARMLGDVGTVQAKAGTRAAMESLKVAETGRDLGRAARLAEVKGGQTLAILKMLGKGALTITGALLHLVWWLFLGVLYAYCMVSSFNAFCVACARRTWRRGGRRARPERQAAAAGSGTAADAAAIIGHEGSEHERSGHEALCRVAAGPPSGRIEGPHRLFRHAGSRQVP